MVMDCHFDRGSRIGVTLMTTTGGGNFDSV
jgi:hypothetical protein